ncbi:Uncharacterized protein Adt_46481 [Abeliophyllum distichum]|uniref:Disease resistance protein winged helix domain-containing protein n=1 Tax=Abeliophyllum distichum TaxID=126358 RepID=A0ABD1NZZ1_9LAMI
MASQNMPSYILKMLNHRIENISESYNINADTVENDIVCSFGELRKDLEKTMSLIPRLKKSEDLLMENFQSLEMQLDEVLVYIRQRIGQIILPRMINDMRNMLQETNEKISDDLRKEEKAPLQYSSDPLDDDKMPNNNWLIEENILDSLIMMSNFQMSYDILSVNSRLCLLTFAVFPEKQLIKKKPLIYWWIGEGFITKSINKTAEEVGVEILMELIDMGLIQPCWFILLKRSPKIEFHDLKGDLLSIINMIDEYPSFSKNFFSKNGRIKVLQLGR